MPHLPKYTEEFLGFNCVFYGHHTIQRCRIADITKSLHPECAGPHNEPLRGVEGCKTRSAPTGMEHSLILRACGTDSAGDAEGAVGDKLACAEPERKRALVPLAVAGELSKAHKGDNVVKRVLVNSVMRSGNWPPCT